MYCVLFRILRFISRTVVIRNFQKLKKLIRSNTVTRTEPKMCELFCWYYSLYILGMGSDKHNSIINLTSSIKQHSDNDALYLKFNGAKLNGL